MFTVILYVAAETHHSPALFLLWLFAPWRGFLWEIICPPVWLFHVFFHCVQLYCCSGRHPRVETILPSAFAMNSWTNGASVSWHNWHEWSERTSDRCTLSLFTVSRDESFLASHVKSLLSLLGRTTSTEQSRGPTQPCSTRSSFSSAPCSAWSSLGEAGSSRIFFFV